MDRMRSRRLTVLVFVSWFVTALCIHCRGDSPVDTSFPLSGELKVQDVLAEVLRANLRIQAQALEKDVAREQLKAERAIFEPDFVAALTREANRRQNTRERFLSQGTTIFDEQNWIRSAGIEGLLPVGGRLRLSGQNRGLENNLQLTGSRESESTIAATLTQPLLKNGGWAATMAQIRLATAQSEVVLQEYRRQLMLVLSQTENVYWDLAGAYDLAAYREQSEKVAERVLADNKARVDAGKMTEIEVLQAEAGLAVRRAVVAEARQRITSASAALMALLGKSAAESAPDLKAADPLAPSSTDTNTTVALTQALQFHPLYLAQLQKNKQDNIRLSYARNQLWPQIDLKASYGLNGLGRQFGTSWDSIESTDFPSWYLGAELRVPLTGGIKARSQNRIAKYRKEQGLIELKAIEVELTTSVGTLMRRVAAAQAKAQSFSGVVALNQRLLDTELARLDGGKSDSRKVLQAEQDLGEARINELDARREWQQAIVELLVQTGTYLDKRGFELK